MVPPPPSTAQDRTIELPTGATVEVHARRSLVAINGSESGEWIALSSSIYNGGFRVLPPGRGGGTTRAAVRVLNSKVPETYDGINPEPVELMKRLIADETDCDDDSDEVAGRERTIGLMTAASMSSLRTASRSSGGVGVDAVVTAGISNARSAGADADYFLLGNRDASSWTPDDDVDDIRKGSEENGIDRRPSPGTINTVVVINGNGITLSSEALVEAYAIAVEAKCRACVEYSLACQKDPGRVAQGTGTDCAVILAPSATADRASPTLTLRHAGKHTLLGEMIGQAVYEATSEAILSNILHLHGSVSRYKVHRWLRILSASLLGSRPFVPPRPMMPIPKAPARVLFVGCLSITLVYLLPFLPRRASALLAAALWDRFLPSVPLAIHPVCLVGSSISRVLSVIPDRVLRSPILGTLGGIILLVGMLALHLTGAWLFLLALGALRSCNMASFLDDDQSPLNASSVEALLTLVAWLAEVAFLSTTFSLQLLCAIALQMAKFLERGQLDAARGQLVWLCSRDPSKLGPSDLAGATLESLSENLSDGTVAPFFWYVVLGPLGALGYRITNTLDSRVGYRGRFEWFGKTSARFDDLVNLIPARITAFLLAFAALFVPNCCFWTGLEVGWQDCSQCDSPNAGWPMGAMAGLLHVTLEKRGQYQLGSNVKGTKHPGPRDIRAGHHIAQLAGWMSLAAAVAARCLFLEMI